ncbi:hypothetical protein [Bacteroides sp. 51]|uniref:hypothetical protein n=1 Tax=Bacteroides sp. 51 TaxID=2302938 RepID=UPI0013D8800F|nr:hypothetical protein [Bacteroides sp. 51]
MTTPFSPTVQHPYREGRAPWSGLAGVPENSLPMDQFLAKLPYRYSNAGQDSLAKTIILDTACVGTISL